LAASLLFPQELCTVILLDVTPPSSRFLLLCAF